MGSLETLPPDQRAVLDLVLQRGRSYDDIASLLAIDRAAVRARALAAFDELGADAGIPNESRALITDYLLGQLPARVAEQTRERLAGSAPERAWARVLASELTPMARKPLPEIPDGSRAPAPAPAPTGDGSRATAPAPAPTGDGPREAAGIPTAAAAGVPTAAATDEASPTDAGTPPTPAGERSKARGFRSRERAPRKRAPREGAPRERRTPRLSDRPSSRVGGAIVLGVGVLIAVGVVVLLIAVLGGGSSKHSTSTPAASGTTPAGTTSTASKSGTTPQAQVVAQTNLNPPAGSSSPAKGVAFVVKEGTAYGIVIEASKVPPNNHNAYAVWLYNSSTDTTRVGFVNPAVGKSGQLQVGSPLPANAGHYKQLLLTAETATNPKTPGAIVLQGPFKGVPATS